MREGGAALNIVLILIDDMGWRDLGCYGSPFYETPRLDRLAAEGVRFTDAYAACPVCSPTRASLLTGKYPARLGVTDYIGGAEHPARGRLIDAPYVDRLSPTSETSIARALANGGGYVCWHVGKWHLAGKPGQSDPSCYPEAHGFVRNIGGCDWGAPRHGYRSPWGLPTLPDGPDGEHLTDRLTDEAVRLIRDHAANGNERPFFLNLWHYAVHTPIQTPDEALSEKYRVKARALGLDAVPTFADGEPFPTEQKGHLRVRRRLVQSDPDYAAMVEHLDACVGRVLDALEETGVAQNTLVIFTSDNGGLATSEGSPTCNAPLAEGKGWMYEGGTREPLIVRWPGVAAPGSVFAVPVTSPDFYPTLLEAAGLPPSPEQHRDGVSFAPLLRGDGAGKMAEHRPLFWHYPHYGNQGGTPGSSVRQGDWKLIEFFEDHRRELYNLRDDFGETRDLAAEEPERVARLSALLAAWRDEQEARYPTPNPNYGPTTT
jgi:arylsulfatase A-like enzyme